MPHPLDGYLTARATAKLGRYIVVRSEEGFGAIYFAGLFWTRERDAATRFEHVPHDVVARFPTARWERA